MVVLRHYTCNRTACDPFFVWQTHLLLHKNIWLSLIISIYMHINTYEHQYTGIDRGFWLVCFTKWDLVSHIVHLDFLTQYPLQIPLESSAPAFLWSLPPLPNILGVDNCDVLGHPWQAGSHFALLWGQWCLPCAPSCIHHTLFCCHSWAGK